MNPADKVKAEALRLASIFVSGISAIEIEKDDEVLRLDPTQGASNLGAVSGPLRAQAFGDTLSDIT